MKTLIPILLGLLAAPSLAADEIPPPPAFDRIVIDADFPGAYQVEAADVDGDGKLDVVAVGGKSCVWYQNPSWTRRVVFTRSDAPEVISSATADVDGDGKAEVAIAFEFSMNQPRRGKLVLAKPGPTVDAPWTYLEVGAFPSIHRMRWGDLDADGRADLMVAPIFGADAKPPTYDDPAGIFAFTTVDPTDAVRWTRRPLADRHVTHAIEFHKTFGPEGLPAVLAADDAGVTRMDLTRKPEDLVPGKGGMRPKGGASEIHLGHFRDGRKFLATIEPWHGSEVVVWPESAKGSWQFGSRTVIDEALVEGHALWVADVNNDGQDEIFAGWRGKDRGVAVYDYRVPYRNWRRTILDREIAAQDMRGGDLDGDGKPDVLAVGGSTRNVIWYRPK